MHGAIQENKTKKKLNNCDHRSVFLTALHHKSNLPIEYFLMKTKFSFQEIDSSEKSLL